MKNLRHLAAFLALALLCGASAARAGDPISDPGAGTTDTSQPGGSMNQSPLERMRSELPEQRFQPKKEEQNEDAVDAPFAFEVLKKLAGEWTGTSMTEDGDSMSVVWHVTAGGNSVVETQFPGTSHEMMSVYYLDEGDLVLTHYCAMGNQPRMRFEPKESTWNVYTFEFDGGSNIDRGKSMHIHEGTIEFQAANRIKAEWFLYEGSKKIGSKIFLLSRKNG